GVDFLDHLADLPRLVGGEVAVDLDVAGGAGRVLEERFEVADDRLVQGDGVLRRLERRRRHRALRVDAAAEVDHVVGVDPPDLPVRAAATADVVVERQAVGALLDPGDVPPSDPPQTGDAVRGGPAAELLGEGVAVDEPIDHQPVPEGEPGQTDRVLEDLVEAGRHGQRAAGRNVGPDPHPLPGVVQGESVKGETGNIPGELGHRRVNPRIREEYPPISGVSWETPRTYEGNRADNRGGSFEVTAGLGGSEAGPEVKAASGQAAAGDKGEQQLEHRNLLDDDRHEIVLGGGQKMPAHTERHGDQG